MSSPEQKKHRAVGIIVLAIMALLVLLLLLQTPKPSKLDVDFSFPPEPLLTPQPDEPVVSQQAEEGLAAQVEQDWREHAPSPDEAEAQAEEEKEPAPYLSGWAVQLWSLSEKSSAQAMIETLNQAGFSAFMRSAEVNGKTVYRVYAGPELNKSKAQVLLDKLKQDESLQISQGLIVLLPK